MVPLNTTHNSFLKVEMKVLYKLTISMNISLLRKDKCMGVVGSTKTVKSPNTPKIFQKDRKTSSTFS